MTLRCHVRIDTLINRHVSQVIAAVFDSVLSWTASNNMQINT